MLDKITAWLKKYNITTHSLAAIGAVLVAAYFQVQSFHDLVFNAYGHFPQWLKELITTGIALYMWYRRGKTPPQQQ